MKQIDYRRICYACLVNVGFVIWAHASLAATCFQEPEPQSERVVVRTKTEWRMHVVDNTSRGADGVRLADFNRDGHPDIVTGWEEGGVIRVYKNPGPKNAKEKWPMVTVGKVKSPEDAVFVDLDSDGQLDVVSCCEGKTNSVFVHWAPTDPDEYLNETAWKTEAFPVACKKAAWMFAVPADIDAKYGIDIFVGAKGKNGCVGWLESPENPRELAGWKFHQIEKAGWIMSLRTLTVDGSLRLLVSDRKGPKRGVYFLKMDSAHAHNWARADISSNELEFMFLDFAKNRDEINVSVATRNGKVIQMMLDPKLNLRSRKEFVNPDQIQFGKAVALGDIDLDGKLDMVHSCNTRSVSNRKNVIGLHWMKNQDERFRPYAIAGTRGKKYDRIELIDLDGDGDLDVLTCEEADNLGVIWFENPTR